MKINIRRQFFLCAILISCIPGVLFSEAFSTFEKADDHPFEIREIFSIGVEEAETEKENPYEFYNIANIDCDKNQNLYVLDYQAHCIKVFDKDGKFTKQILSKGQGPKEISNFVRFKINKFTNHLFVLQNFGFSMKEFDISGNFVKSYVLPLQFIYYFDFIDKDRAIFITHNTNNKEKDYNFKIVNIKTRKIEKAFAGTKVNSYLRISQRFSINKDKLWTSPCDGMDVLAYNLDSYEKTNFIRIPGKFKKNLFKSKPTHGGSTIVQVYFNRANPFFVGQHLFILTTIQDYKVEKKQYADYPHTSKLSLYYMVGDNLKKLETLEGFDYMEFGAVKGNRVFLFSNDPYPRIKAIEIKSR
jgi:hypothetical protein